MRPAGLSELGGVGETAFELRGDAGRTVVAIDGETVLGSAKMGPNRPGHGAHVATGSFRSTLPTRAGAWDMRWGSTSWTGHSTFALFCAAGRAPIAVVAAATNRSVKEYDALHVLAC